MLAGYIDAFHDSIEMIQDRTYFIQLVIAIQEIVSKVKTQQQLKPVSTHHGRSQGILIKNIRAPVQIQGRQCE